MGKYQSIISMHRPISEKHGKMSRVERAKQFAPFAALKGFEDAIGRENRTLLSKPTLSKEMTEQIDQRLRSAQAGDFVSISYFIQDDTIPQYGMVGIVSGVLQKIDTVERVVYITGTTISLDDILDVKRN